MHVAIVGQGALGSVYGVRLASRTDAEVTFVVRDARSDDASPLVIERADGDRAMLRIEAPRRTTRVPSDADVIVVAVGVTDLGELEGLIGEGAAPIVVLTPLLPDDHARLVAAFGPRLLPAMPSIAAYRNDEGRVRYWLPRVATTLVEEPAPPRLAPAAALVRALESAGVPSRLQKGVFAINAATTVTFLPLAFALDVAGSADALLDDRELLKLAIEGAEEGEALGRTLGPPASWAAMLVRFIGPTMLKMGVGLARRRSPEAVRYVETHFGFKMHAQNVIMARAMDALADARGLPHRALGSLAERLRSREPRAAS
jgi:2-dehydropantoate 2-reductase